MQSEEEVERKLLSQLNRPNEPHACTKSSVKSTLFPLEVSLHTSDRLPVSNYLLLCIYHYSSHINKN